MRLPRVSIRGLMLFVVAAAFAFTALRFSTPNVAGIVILLTLFGLGLAMLATLYRREGHRAFWFGFALMGWGYAAFSYGSWTLAEKEIKDDGKGFAMIDGRVSTFSRPQPPMLGHWLVTTTLLDTVRPSVQAGNDSGLPSTRVTSLLGFTDSRSRLINAALDRPLRMPFIHETPLEDVIKYIQSKTQGPGMPEGIPIYVDPLGLQEAEKTTSSTVRIEFDGVPLRIPLRLLLQQLNLVYTIDDGVLTITNALQVSNTDAVQSFRRVGHCLFALVFGLIGGFAARRLHATRDRDHGAERSFTSPGSAA